MDHPNPQSLPHIPNLPYLWDPLALLDLPDISDISSILNFLNVSKFQKQIFLFSYEPSNERNYILNSASKMSQIKKN